MWHIMVKRIFLTEFIKDEIFAWNIYIKAQPQP